MKLIIDFNNEDFECVFCKFALREQSHLVNYRIFAMLFADVFSIINNFTMFDAFR